MLSQRIALLASDYVESSTHESSEQTRTELLQHLELFNRSHFEIEARSSQLNPDSNLRDIYGDGRNLHSQVADFTHEVKQLVNEDDHENKRIILERIRSLSRERLLNDLDAVVAELEDEAESFDRKIVQLEFCILLTLLVGVIGEAVFIFEPMIRSLRSTVEDLDSSATEMSWAADP